MLQAANLEALRAAQGVGEDQQRELARQRVAQIHAAEEQASVRVVPHSEAIRAEEREGRRQEQEREQERAGAQGESAPEAREGQAQAGSADGHLDLLA